MNGVLEDRLVDLFARAGDAVPVAADLERAIGGAALEARQAARPRRRTVVIAAAVVAAFAGIAGVTRFVDRDQATTVAEAPGVAGPLYLLPGEASGWLPAHGSSGSSVLPGFGVVVIGVPDGAGFVDVVSLRVHTAAPPDFPDGWTEARFPGGPGWVSSEFGQVAQERDGTWFWSMPADDRGALLAIDAIDDVVLGDDATATMVAGSPFEVVDQYDPDGPGELQYATFDAERADGLRAIVDTVTIDAGIAGGDAVAAFTTPDGAELRPITVRGVDGWVATFPDDGDDASIISWRIDRDHVAVVSGTSPVDALVELAAGLEVVDAATWDAATGRGDRAAATIR